MKHVLAPLTALVLIATGYSLHAAGWFNSAKPRQAAVHAASDRYASDAALRHRSAQPYHWRAMLLVK